jgi:DNA-binding transcriptional ArsR family regulator
MSSDARTTDAGEGSTEAFADGTPLVRLFGGGARTRILAVLVDERDRDLNISELARQAGLARKTVYEHIEDLVDIGAAELSRETKQSRRFRLADTAVGQKLYELDGVTLQQIVDADAISDDH